MNFLHVDSLGMRSNLVCWVRDLHSLTAPLLRTCSVPHCVPVSNTLSCALVSEVTTSTQKGLTHAFVYNRVVASSSFGVQSLRLAKCQTFSSSTVLALPRICSSVPLLINQNRIWLYPTIANRPITESSSMTSAHQSWGRPDTHGCTQKP
jgi:hypothetical protein